MEWGPHGHRAPPQGRPPCPSPYPQRHQGLAVLLPNHLCRRGPWSCVPCRGGPVTPSSGRKAGQAGATCPREPGARAVKGLKATLHGPRTHMVLTVTARPHQGRRQSSHRIIPLPGAPGKEAECTCEHTLTHVHTLMHMCTSPFTRVHTHTVCPRPPGPGWDPFSLLPPSAPFLLHRGSGCRRRGSRPTGTRHPLHGHKSF